MQLTVTTTGDEIFTLQVSDDLELENFKALLEFECGIASQEMLLFHNGQPLADAKKKLTQYGIKDGDVILLQHSTAGQRQDAAAPQRPGQGMDIDFGSIQIPGVSTAAGTSNPSGSGAGRGGQRAAPTDDPATIRDMLLGSPHDLAILKERNPPLAEALVSGDLERFTAVLSEQQKERSDRERDRIRMITADPFDMEMQTKIAEDIRLKNVEANMESAMEYSPESFAQVTMLYIDCKVNGYPLKAFVDSGAQMTIMSQNCAERCNIMRLVDTRWAGIAKGVGTQRIIGRVHQGQIQIGKDYLPSSFSILEDQPMDMLLGLDLLKRHQCCIDLKKNVIHIGTTGAETRFLPEGELPEHARLNKSHAPDEDNDLAEALHKSAKEAAGKKPTTTSSSSSSSTPSTSTKPSAAASSSLSSPQFPTADVKRLTDYGFSNREVVRELTRSSGNVDQALAALFARSFQVPPES